MTLFAPKEMLGLLPAAVAAALLFYFAPQIMSAQAAAAFGALGFFGFFYVWAGTIMQQRETAGAPDELIRQMDTVRKTNLIIPPIMYLFVGLVG